MKQHSHRLPLISCIIPVYNRETLIVECIGSVLAQSVKEFEILIVDDGSTDNTLNAVSQLANANPDKIKILQQTNQGPGAARQAGLNQASGRYIQFLDSDDLLLPEKFDHCLRVFESPDNPDIVNSVTHYYHIDTPQNRLVWKENQHKIKSILPQFFVSRAWATSTPVYKKSLLDKAGNILALSCEEDLEYDCRIGLQNPSMAFIDKHLTDFRDHGGQRFSAGHVNRKRQLSDQIQARNQIYKIIQKFGLPYDSMEMKFFSQTMFLLARQAGEFGLVEPSKLALAIATSTGSRLSPKNKLAMEIYKATNLIAGRQKGSLVFNAIYNRLNRARVKAHPMGPDSV